MIITNSIINSVLFVGNAAPYRITQPAADHSVRIISSAATTANVMFSLNVTLSPNFTVMWFYNGSSITRTAHYDITQAGNTTTLVILDPQQSDAGVYQCVATDRYGWTLRRIIMLGIKMQPFIMYFFTWDNWHPFHHI